VRIRFNGKRRVAVTSGVFNDETKSTKTIFHLPDLSRHIDVELSMRAGTAHVTVTDDRGNTYDTGDLSGAASSSNDTYRLKLRAIKVRGVAVPGFFDDVQVSRGRHVGTAGATHFVFDSGGRLIGEYDAADSSNVEYVYIENQPLAMLQGGAIYYYHTDQLGTPQILTDHVQEIVWRANYTPFGNTIISANVVDNSLRFPGQYFDAETGLHYNRFRDYDPAVGRYTESDPIGVVGGVNTYAYVEGNPIRLKDPFGLFTLDGVIEEMSEDMFPVVDQKTEAIIGLDSSSRIRRCKRQAFERCRTNCIATTAVKEALGATTTKIATEMAEDIITATARLAIRAAVKNAGRISSIFSVADLNRCIAQCAADPKVVDPPDCRPGCILK
jgi:RHS repeat-associated protein